jgi:hypothetical protein
MGTDIVTMETMDVDQEFSLDYARVFARLRIQLGSADHGSAGRSAGISTHTTESDRAHQIIDVGPANP